MVYRRFTGLWVCKGLTGATKEMGKNDRGLFAAATQSRECLCPAGQPPRAAAHRSGIREHLRGMANPVHPRVHEGRQGQPADCQWKCEGIPGKNAEELAVPASPLRDERGQENGPGQDPGVDRRNERRRRAPRQLTTLFAQLLLANASGFALNAKPIPKIYPMASFRASLLLKCGLVLMSACTSMSTLYRLKRLHSSYAISMLLATSTSIRSLMVYW